MLSGGCGGARSPELTKAVTEAIAANPLMPKLIAAVQTHMGDTPAVVVRASCLCA